MTSTQIAGLSAIILVFVFVDVLCDDVRNARQATPWRSDQSSQKPFDVSNGGKGTTPWPLLGQRWTERTTVNNNGPSQGPKKWIQQNNIWIRNEQVSSAGINGPDNGQAKLSGHLPKPVSSGGLLHSSGSLPNSSKVKSSTPKSNLPTSSSRSELSTSSKVSLLTPETPQNVPKLINNTPKSNIPSNPVDKSGSTTPKTGIPRPTNRLGSSSGASSSLDWIKNEQAASGGISGPGKGQTGSSSHLPKPVTSGGFLIPSGTQNLPKVVNNTPKLNLPTSNKPGSYAGAVGGSAQTVSTTPKSNLPTSSSKSGSYASAAGGKVPPPLLPPKSNAVSAPKGSVGGDNINTLSTGPSSDLEGNQDVDEIIPDNSGTTDEELRQFSEMLIKKDTNNAMKYVTLQLQGMTTSRSTNDEAPQPLLKVDSAAYQIPSIEKLKLLYNNYILESNQNEVYTPQERIEENNLLDTVLATPVMQFARSFLIQKGKIGKDPREFKDLLRQIWFNMYSRGQGRIGSSGFEHVFLAEIKKNQVSGLHNWLYFEEEESKQHANYLGYMRKIDLGDKGAIVKYHFRFNDIDKPVGSMFIGTSPELEMAVYSTCFILRPDRICPLKMGGNRFVVRTFTYRYRSKNLIGSAFPEI